MTVLQEPALRLVGVTQQYGAGSTAVSGIVIIGLGLLAVALLLGIAAVAWLVPPRHPELTRRTAIT